MHFGFHDKITPLSTAQLYRHPWDWHDKSKTWLAVRSLNPQWRIIATKGATNAVRQAALPVLSLSKDATPNLGLTLWCSQDCLNSQEAAREIKPLLNPNFTHLGATGVAPKRLRGCRHQRRLATSTNELPSSALTLAAHSTSITCAPSRNVG